MEKTILAEKQAPLCRNSNIELLRILSMFIIVAHHYVVNSGLIGMVYSSTSSTELNAIFLLLFGWGGKTAINSFVLITGYFMCKSNITIRKFLKIFFEVMFYKILIYVVFIISGYVDFSMQDFLKSCLPFISIKDDFTGCFLIFFLFIPFINILINAMTEKQHITLIGISLITYTVLPSLKVQVVFNYVTWFIIIYLISAYIRCYQSQFFSNKKLWGILAISSLLLSWLSVIVLTYIGNWFGKPQWAHFFVSDSNKILAVVTAVSAFVYFKNLNIKNSRLINKIAASTFGVLLIHANSDIMRNWLWRDTLKNTEFYNSPYLILHALGCVLVVYIICTLIDWARIKWIEKPVFALYDKHKMNT